MKFNDAVGTRFEVTLAVILHPIFVYLSQTTAKAELLVNEQKKKKKKNISYFSCLVTEDQLLAIFLQLPHLSHHHY